MYGKVKQLNETVSNPHYTRHITTKNVTSGGGPSLLCGFVPVQHSSEKTSQQWRVVGGAVSELTRAGIEPTLLVLIAMPSTTTITGLPTIFAQLQVKAISQE